MVFYIALEISRYAEDAPDVIQLVDDAEVM
jgi:hypothetical protein